MGARQFRDHGIRRLYAATKLLEIAHVPSKHRPRALKVPSAPSRRARRLPRCGNPPDCLARLEQ